MFSQDLPFEGLDQADWTRWLPGNRRDLPREWRASGERRRAADGGEYELIGRLVELDPLEQRHSLQMRARLWRDGELVAEEVGSLDENLYFVQELRLMLKVAGFSDVAVEGRYTGEPATPDDGRVVFVARAD
jgi:hypothetical protein